MLRYLAACSYDRGASLAVNEDNFQLGQKTLPPERPGFGVLKETGGLRRPLLLAVFDGMGGMGNGALASGAAAESCLELSKQSFRCPKDRLSEMKSLCLRLHKAVREASRTARCGSTAVLALVESDQVSIVNVGDSPAFLWRDGVLSELTVEDSDRQLLTKMHAVGRSPRLTQYLGMQGELTQPQPHTAAIPPRAGDRYLLCSDGLTAAVPLRIIETICAGEPDAGRCADLLLSFALEQGGEDNITVIVCDLV